MTDLRHPLAWPAGWPVSRRHESSLFGDRTLDRARKDLEAELRRLGARGVVISTNVELRLDGYPRANAESGVYRKGLSAGVAVYFKLEGRDHALACDRWDRIPDNMRALTKHIEALRGMDRWGVGSVKQAFAGYRALPAPEGEAPKVAWWQLLGFSARPSKAKALRTEIAMRYRAKSKDLHPDRGGDPDAFKQLVTAKEHGLEYAGE